MTREKAIPRGRVGRLVRMAGAGLRAGAGKLVSGDPSSTIHSTAEALGTLRGLAAKVGQMASYVDGMVPAQHSELYESIMGKLRNATPTSSPTAVCATIEEDLGAPVRDLFATFDEVPFASASLGQVHRATLHNGRAVAVKVQHPGVDEAVESDLSNLTSIEAFIRPLSGGKMDTKAVVANLCARFREELDYTVEARHQATFARLHEADPSICVPAVIADRSSRRVLTSEFVEGATLEHAAGEREDVRRAYAETMWRFVFRGNFVGRVFNTDPHPGNYIFLPNGKVAFLDFGCVQPLTDHMFEYGLAQYRAALDRDEQAFEKATIDWYRVDDPLVNAHTRHCFEPVFASPFRLTRAYAGSLLEESGTIAKKAKGDPKSPPPPELPLFNRLQFGFYSVLARLDVEVDYAAASRAVLSEAAGPVASCA